MLPASTETSIVGEGVTQSETNPPAVDIENSPCPRCKNEGPWGFTTGFPKTLVCSACSYYLTFEDMASGVPLEGIFKSDPDRKWEG